MGEETIPAYPLFKNIGKSAIRQGACGHESVYFSLSENILSHLVVKKFRRAFRRNILWRRRAESNRRIGVLQTPALPLGYYAANGSNRSGFCAFRPEPKRLRHIGAVRCAYLFVSVRTISTCAKRTPNLRASGRLSIQMSILYVYRLFMRS